MDFILTDEETVYVTTLKVLNRRAKEKDFVQSFFAKSPSVYEDLKRLRERRLLDYNNQYEKKKIFYIISSP